MRPHTVGGVKVNVIAQELWMQVEKCRAAKLDQSRIEPRQRIVYEQEFVMFVARSGELTFLAGVAYPHAKQGFIKDDVLVSKERMQGGRAGSQRQRDPKYNEDFQDFLHFSPILSGRSNLFEPRPTLDSDFLSLEFHRRAIFSLCASTPPNRRRKR